MLNIRGSIQTPPDLGPTVVAIGIFDGVHRGHRVLLERAVALGHLDDLKSVAFSFSPHPAQVLARNIAPSLIEPIEVRLERFAALGLDATVIETFDLQLAALTPLEFVKRVLLDRLHIRHVVIGANFSFGRGGAGSVDDLIDFGEEYQFGVHVIAPVRVSGLTVSSTKIREFIMSGQMDGAELLLGRPFSFWGDVVRGAGRGAGIGFPTANLNARSEIIPATGVYACRVWHREQSYQAVANVGYAPTFGGRDLCVEVHLLDYDGPQLYDEILRVDFLQLVRKEKKFSGAEELKTQIASDIQEARLFFDETNVEDT